MITRRLTVVLLVFHLGPKLKVASGQTLPTAVRPADFTVFAGATRSYAGLSGAHDSSVTAGADLNLPVYRGLRPSLELRATVPFERPAVIAQKTLLGGLRAESSFGRAHPYIDFLVGRGTMTYTGGYTTYSGNFLFGSTSSLVISPGAGIRFKLGSNLFAFADGQFQHWNTPASLSGHLFAKPLTAGLVYRFSFTRHGSKVATPTLP